MACSEDQDGDSGEEDACESDVANGRRGKVNGDDDDDEECGDCKGSVCCWSIRSKMEVTKRATTMSSTIAVGTITWNDEVSEDPKSSQRQEKKVMVVLSRETTRET